MTRSLSLIEEPRPTADPQGIPALPRLLTGIPSRGAMSLGEHLAVHGAPPSARARGLV
jgi:hypothetical protein